MHVYMTGARGLLGRAMRIALAEMDALVSVPTQYVDATNPRHLQNDMVKAIQMHGAIDSVVHLAGRVGGIRENMEKPFDLMSVNVRLAANLFHVCERVAVKSVFTMGSVCAYPGEPKIYPIVEDSLWDGYPEITNGPYGISKRVLYEVGNAFSQQTGVPVCHVVLANLYGPGYKMTDTHVIPQLIRKFIDAVDNEKPTVQVWGDGSARRDFLFVEDAARAIRMLMLQPKMPQIINVGSGREVTIKELAETVKALSGFEGEIIWDVTKPVGQTRRLLNTERIARLGWQPLTSFPEGLRKTILYYNSVRFDRYQE